MSRMNMEARLNRKQAADFLGVSPQVVGMWKVNGKLTPAGCDEKGHPLYRVADLLAVDREVRLSGRSHRAA